MRLGSLRRRIGQLRSSLLSMRSMSNECAMSSNSMKKILRCSKKNSEKTIADTNPISLKLSMKTPYSSREWKHLKLTLGIKKSGSQRNNLLPQPRWTHSLTDSMSRGKNYS